MTTKKSDPAYILEWDDSHLLDIDVDASIVKFPGWENTIRLSLNREYDLPNRIEFEAIFDSLKNTDYPINNVRWPIMSQKMLDILASINKFAHKVIPVTMVDCQVLSYEQGIAKKSGIENNNFVAVQILEYLDLLDWEKSIVTPSFILDDQVMAIQKLVLKETDSPLPALFRLSAYPTAVFVSAQGRSALEEARIKGIIFQDIANFQA